MKLTQILPFMEMEDLKELALKIINNEVKGVKLSAIYPFLSRESLDEMIELLIENGNGKEITKVLPFASNDSIKKILKGIKDGSITNVSESNIYPFLGKEDLKEMFDILVKQANDTYEESSDEEEQDDLDD